MRWLRPIWAAVLTVGAASAAHSSTQPGEVVARAHVTVSDGTGFTLETRYRDIGDAAYIRTRPNGASRLWVDGGGVWSEDGRGRDRLPAEMGAWILAHQFHAQLLFFEDLNPGATSSPAPAEICACDDLVSPLAADGGGLLLRRDRASGRARELLVLRGGASPVRIGFSDWRPASGRELPFVVTIDDGSRTFIFRYDRIEVR